MRVEHLFKAYGDRTVLDDISFEIAAPLKAGLVGRNGAGKTTLFRLLLGEIPADGGTLKLTGSVGYLPQQPADFGGTLAQFLEQDPAPRIPRAKLLQQAGLAERLLQSDFATLSGGEKTRAGLARLLAGEPEIMLLDEPTNHLDLQGIEWLAEWVGRFPGNVLVISHDRYFLDRVAGAIFDLEDGKIRRYSGNYSAYAAQKQLEREQADEAYQAYRQEKRRLEEAYRRKMEEANRITKKRVHRDGVVAKGPTDFYAGKSKKVARNAKAIEKRLEQLEPKARPKADVSLQLELDEKTAARSRILAEGRGLRKQYGTRAILDGVDLLLRRGGRVALTGANGTGKTTLLRLVAGELPADAGELRLAPSVRLGVIDQESKLLREENTILAEVGAVQPDRVAVRNLLACLLFRGDDVHKPIAVLSRGERVRVSLAKLILSGCNLLLLDEPTNHLDLASREAVEEALLDYPGTLLFVSHDRYFLNKLATEVWQLGEGKLRVFPGGFREYEAERNRPRPLDREERLLLEHKLARLAGELAGAAEGQREELEREYLEAAQELRRLKEFDRP
jgi:ATPase subunit of ABC transporter with duplicated ATPase domains